MNIYEKLTLLQAALKAPKGQFNKFGNFHYRSLEDIVEGVKPLLINHKLTLIMYDTVKQIGDRYYIETTANLINSDDPQEKIITTASAREANEKKGMDSSQITGAASSYARKYCMNGLFAIDDNRDDDVQQNQNQTNTVTQTAEYNGKNGSSNGNNGKSLQHQQPQTLQIQGLSKEQLDWLVYYCKKNNYSDSDKKDLMKQFDFNPKTTSPSEFEKIKQQIEADAAAKISVVPA